MNPDIRLEGPAQPSDKEREAYRKAAPLDAGETGEVSREPGLAKEHVDKLYEPLTNDEMNALLSAVRHFHHPRSPSLSAMSRAANKIEAQLHLSLTGHRIYEGPSCTCDYYRITERATRREHALDCPARTGARP